jgi:hypothetical protein
MRYDCPHPSVLSQVSGKFLEHFARPNAHLDNPIHNPKLLAPSKGLDYANLLFESLLFACRRGFTPLPGKKYYVFHTFLSWRGSDIPAELKR